ncbi:MAG: HlyC/CorC family transporter [Bacteroidales bacterium]|nr:HlyC/CorC family transporter [Candidatus Physcousia equi]
MHDTTYLVISTIIVLLFSAFFSGMEIAFVSSSKLRYEIDKQDGGLSSKALSVFYKHPNNFISTLLVGNNIALVIYGILMAQLIGIYVLVPLGLHPEDPSETCSNDALCLVIQTVISTLVVLFTGEFLPKTIFKRSPNHMLSVFALPMYIIYVILYPLSKFTSGLSKLLLRICGVKLRRNDGDSTFTKVDLDYLIQSSIDEAENEEEVDDEVRMFQNALDFSSVKVRDCIVPRTEIDGIDSEATLETLKIQFVESGHSKIVVYGEDVDDIKGYVHSSEMFRLKSGDDWTKSIREVPFVPETMPAQKLLKTFIQQKRSIAVVVDEFGGTSGIITLEDLVEEIFGEIEDEHDSNTYTMTDLGNGEYLLSARLEIEQVNEKLSLDLPESDQYLTVGGLILHEYQSFPKLNEVVKVGRFEFKIMQKTTTKIELVRLKVN